MHVLIAHPSADVYGSDLQLVQSIRALKAKGWRVTLVLPAEGPLLEHLSVDHVIIQRFTVLRKSALKPTRILPLAAQALVDLIRLTVIIRRAGAHLVYVNTITIPTWPFAARLCRRRVLTHVHEAEQDLPKAIRRLLYLSLNLAHRIIVNSRASQHEIVTTYPRLERSVSLVYNGIPPLENEPQLDLSNINQLVFVGRISPRKGVHVAIDAVALLHSFGYPVSLQIWGSTYQGYEWYEADLRSKVHDNGLGDAVSFEGYCGDLNVAFDNCVIVLVPSLAEPFGNVAVEASMAKRVVIASDVQGLAEIVSPGRTGYLVRPGDATDLAHTVQRLLKSPTECVGIANAAKRNAETHFNLAGYMDSIVSEVNNLIARKDA